jgi:hypothetical protein
MYHCLIAFGDYVAPDHEGSVAISVLVRFLNNYDY